MTAPRILGVDPSLTALGLALPDGTTTTLRTKLTGCDRLIWLRGKVIERAEVYGRSGVWDEVQAVAIEGYSMGSPGRGTHAHAIGELGGVLRVALHERSIPVVEVPPATLKVYATSRGNAAKNEVLVAAVNRLGYDGHDDNAADALWLRAVLLDALGHPVVSLPQTHRRALAKLDLSTVQP